MSSEIVALPLLKMSLDVRFLSDGGGSSTSGVEEEDIVRAFAQPLDGAILHACKHL